MKTFLGILFSCAIMTISHSQSDTKMNTEKEIELRSVTFLRYKASNPNFEAENPFSPMFSYSLTTGLGYDGTHNDKKSLPKN